VRRGVTCSLGIATAGAVVLGLGAHLALSILGRAYAHAGVEPLRILLLAVLPLTFIQAYFSSCRARQDLGEAIATGWVNAITSLAAAAMAGVTHGLIGMAIAWVAVQYATGLWSLWRLRIVSVSMGSEPAVPAAAGTVTR
jgi:O-antigen/teichoic acid export membrane protein